MTCTLPMLVHVCHLYTSCKQSPYVKTFHGFINKVEWIHCSQEIGTPNYILSTSADQIADSHPISLLTATKAVGKAMGKSQASVDNQLHRCIGPISPACDQYIQYLLVGINPSVLNRHRRGLQPWRCVGAHKTSISCTNMSRRCMK
jgi:hypothetical protein